MKTAGGGKAKGSAFEWEIAQALSKWCTNNEKDDVVVRSVLSGGQFTQTARGTPGDLASSHPVANELFSKFVVECKHWADLGLYNMLFPPRNLDNSYLYYALKKVAGEAVSSGRPHWMLVARQSRSQTIAIVPFSFYFPGLLLTKSVTFHTLFNGSMIVFKFYEFTEKVPVSEWLAIANPSVAFNPPESIVKQEAISNG